MENQQELREELEVLENEYAEAFKKETSFEVLRIIFIRIKEIRKELGIDQANA